MTSVPNRLPLSSGSKIIILLLLLAPAMSSCELFKKAQTEEPAGKKSTGELDPIQGRRVYDPATGTWKEVRDLPSQPMDTVRWTKNKDTQKPPIGSPGTPTRPNTGGSSPTTTLGKDEYNSVKLSSYNVVFALPFLTDRFTGGNVPDNALWALNFYGGAKMALDLLDREGVKLNVSLADTRAESGATTTLIRSDQNLTNAHLIIGPYRRENVTILADFAKEKGKVLVSPFSAAAGVTQRNPDFIQVNPTLPTHCEAIMRHALSRYSPENIVLVGREKDGETARFQFFKDEYQRQRGTKATPLRELSIKDQSASLGSVDVAPYLSQRDTAVFIVPSWSDEIFIISLLRKLEIAKGNFTHVVVYGMPQWMNFERVDYGHYEKLKVHVSSSSFTDLLSSEVRQFRQQFFDQYGTVPAPEAFLGYDATLYFGRMLHKYGTKFQYHIEKEQANGLHTRFDFERVVTPGKEGQGTLELFENKYLNILKFEDYQFQLAN